VHPGTNSVAGFLLRGRPEGLAKIEWAPPADSAKSANGRVSRVRQAATIPLSPAFEPEVMGRSRRPWTPQLALLIRIADGAFVDSASRASNLGVNSILGGWHHEYLLAPYLTASRILAGHSNAFLRRTPQLRSQIGRSRRHFLQALSACMSSKLTVCPRGDLLQPAQGTAWRMSCFFTIRGPLSPRQIRNGLKEYA
jgi:hypothetical protein